MKRKDFTAAVLNIIGATMCNGHVYCDRSASVKNPYIYFMRFKFPGISDHVKSHFDHYKVLIKTYLDQIGAGDTEVKLNKTRGSWYNDFYYIEIVFFHDRPWMTRKTSIKPTVTHVEVPDYEFSSYPSKQSSKMVTVKKSKLANLIRAAFKNNPQISKDTLFEVDDEFLVELFKQL